MHLGTCYTTHKQKEISVIFATSATWPQFHQARHLLGLSVPPPSYNCMVKNACTTVS
eukprot:c57030_g1_i1 orf=3-170(-)